MRSRGLRLWAVVWLMCQVVSLSALVPRDCCPDHRARHDASEPACHTARAPEPECPMRSAGGVPCPMHQSSEARGEDPSVPRCSLHGTCAGPMAALMTLLASQGILTRPVALAPDVLAARVAPLASETPVSHPGPPDPLPPRA